MSKRLYILFLPNSECVMKKLPTLLCTVIFLGTIDNEYIFYVTFDYILSMMYFANYCKWSWFWWPHGLRCGSVPACLVGLWVGILPGAWMFVSCECCVLSGRGLCIGLITHIEESYLLWCVIECDHEASITRRAWPDGCCCTMGGGGIANEYPVQLNKHHMCLETAWYPFVIKMTNQVLVSAVNSLSVIAGNNPAILPEKKSVYAKLYFPAARTNSVDQSVYSIY